jgi:hypothetical protein
MAARWRGDRIRKKIEKMGGPPAKESSTGDSTCFYCGNPYNPGQEGGHHFPSCDVQGCGSLEHPGCCHGS